jgi:hypothetical protein
MAEEEAKLAAIEVEQAKAKALKKEAEPKKD